MTTSVETSSCWYLIQTKSGDEDVAREHLERQGYGAYLPQVVRRRRHRGRRIRQVCPLFPRYLFLQLILGEQDLTPAKSTKGVLHIVRFGLMYAVVPDVVVDQLKQRAHPRTGLHTLDDGSLRKNDPVRIADGSGPFCGLEGVFLQECGEDRVVVLLNLIGHETRVEIAETYVEPLAARI